MVTLFFNEIIAKRTDQAQSQRSWIHFICLLITRLNQVNQPVSTLSVIKVEYIHFLLVLDAENTIF